MKLKHNARCWQGGPRKPPALQENKGTKNAELAASADRSAVCTAGFFDYRLLLQVGKDNKSSHII